MTTHDGTGSELVVRALFLAWLYSLDVVRQQEGLLPREDGAKSPSC